MSKIRVLKVCKQTKCRKFHKGHCGVMRLPTIGPTSGSRKSHNTTLVRCTHSPTRLWFAALTYLKRAATRYTYIYSMSFPAHNSLVRSKGSRLKGWLVFAIGALLAACLLSTCEARMASADTSSEGADSTFSLLHTSGVPRR